MTISRGGGGEGLRTLFLRLPLKRKQMLWNEKLKELLEDGKIISIFKGNIGDNSEPQGGGYHRPPPLNPRLRNRDGAAWIHEGCIMKWDTANSDLLNSHLITECKAFKVIVHEVQTFGPKFKQLKIFIFEGNLFCKNCEWTGSFF